MADGASTNADTTSQNNDIISEGFGARTQSYTSVASSQASRQSRLPDYDFGEDDRPGKYSGGKNKDKKATKTVKKTDKSPKKLLTDSKKGAKDTKNRVKDSKKAKSNSKIDNKQKQPDKTSTKSKKEEKVKEKKVKETKEKPEKKKKEMKEKTENKREEKGKKEETAKIDQSGKVNEAFQSELQSAVSAQAEVNQIREEEAKIDVATTSLAEEDMTSRDDSKDATKKGKMKSETKSGRSNNKSASKSKKKGRSTSIGSSVDSIGGLSDDLSDYVSDSTSQLSDDVTDGGGKSKNSVKSKKVKKKHKKVKKNKKKEGPTIITINDDDYDDPELSKPRRTIFKVIPVPSKTEPLIYNCCFCCSLGAGSLLTGIIFVLFSIGFIYIRSEEMKLRNVNGIWVGKNLLPDVWRILLVIGMITSSLCLIASLILVIASCLWGQKEHYRRIQKCITLWIACTTSAFLNNLGEAFYVQMMPLIIYKDYFHSSDSIESIKEQATKLWIMASLHAVLFLYLTLVLVSYLRLLKYMDSPKIGTAPKKTATISARLSRFLY